ncbi:MAG TPA: choice-of-anchor L domain-containing protein [Flavobacterium sp.]|jgi:gliding motility-associated-like protein
MKKLLLLMLLLRSFAGFSQAITVNTASHTVPQLVNNVLINSPCVSATNITWRTGSNYGSVNGIGFFQNANPNFPMQAGVVLSTGSAMNAQGPNTSHLNDGSAMWVGDADLEETLQQSGISMNSTNATVLEFDFTPISTHFNFDFVFASEEYGNFQCQFSDAFAFLLTNVNTGVTTNLAVVPNTTTPISVVTIRDFLYNSSCGSQNPQYFGSFNGGSAAAGSATNFNGQTVLLNASSTLVPNTPYHIKLVIADRSDAESDSSIFISSDSFNIGQDVLGLDLTVANDTAVCFGGAHTLSTNLDPTVYTFTWKKNGVTIAGATAPSITVTEPGTYSVTYANILNACQPVTDEIAIEFYPQMTTPDPIALYKCDNGSASHTFDLSINTPILVGATPLALVSYHASLSDANNNINPLPASYTVSSNQTVYARIKNPDTQCFTVKSFGLELTPPPVANPPGDMVKCARSQTLLNAIFFFNNQTTAILGGQSPAIYTVTYYTSETNAINGVNAIATTNLISTGQTIYVRVENTTDPSCYSITSFNMIVNLLPPVDEFEDVIVCDSYVLPALTNGSYFTGMNGTGDPMSPGDMIGETMMIYIFNQPGGPDTCAAGTNFKVTVIDPLTLSPTGGTYCGSYTLPQLDYGDYHTQAGGNGDIIAAGTVITTSQTVYVYYETPEEPFCVIDTDFNVTILPTPEVGNFPNVFNCTSYTLPPLSVGGYFTAPDGGGSPIAAGTVITTSQTVYVHAASTGTPVCTDSASFNVYIGFPQPANISQCEPYTLPVLPIGNYYTAAGGAGTQIAAGTVISTPQTIYVYIPNTNNPNCMADVHFTVTVSQPPIDVIENVVACSSYVLPDITHGTYYSGPSGTGTAMNAGDVITTNQTVYIYSQFTANCSNESSFTVTINPAPAIDSRSDIDVCNAYILTALTDGAYYTGPGGTGTMLPAGTVINASQTIYIYKVSETTPPCISENLFEIYIFSVEADDPADVTACDSYLLQPLTIGNYYTLPGGPAGGGTMLNAGHAITASTTLYIYTESGERINCSDENIFNITINTSPVVAPISDKNACGSYTLPALTLGDYFTAPGGTGTMLHAGDVLTSSQTIYVYAQTGTTPNCADEESFHVNVFNVSELPDVTTCDSYKLPALAVGHYYTGAGGTGTMLNAGSSVHASQTIYIYAQSPFAPVCSDETSFVVTIVDAPVAHAVPPSMTKACDEDGFNDGVTTFDLTTLTSTILGSQTGPEFSIAYYENMEDAVNGTDAVTATTNTLVYVKVTNALAPLCYDIKPIMISIMKLPVPTPVGGIICYDTETETLLNPYTISSGLNPSNHNFMWQNEAGVIVGNGSTYTAVVPGTYTLTVVNTATGCASEPVSVDVVPSEPAIVTYTVSEDFADTQSVTVMATGTGGDYEYQLDGGPWQDSNIFSDVASGIHTVTVRDKNGCGSTTVEALVINYPHYFTPNADGFHDDWNIKDLSVQTDAKISIFDRYGKLLTVIKPSGNGWDGTYNGQLMPSTDYWFVVNYKDQDSGVAREFKAHFAMKR